VPGDRGTGNNLHHPNPERAANGHHTWVRVSFQKLECSADTMHQTVLPARIEHNPLEHGGDGRRQRNLWRPHRAWGRCRFRRDEQISGRRDSGDDP
jgi:hypothetical protein